jgi:hypothetical protein
MLILDCFTGLENFSLSQYLINFSLKYCVIVCVSNGNTELTCTVYCGDISYSIQTEALEMP